jgi:phytoene synthase
MTTIEGNTDAVALCAALVREHDFSRYAATLFVAPELRRPLLSLYALNVEISRVSDQVSQPLPGEIRLQWWSDMLTGQAHGGVEGNPVAAELLLAVREFALPVERLTRLIEEHQFDLYNDPMPTMAALDGYLDDTSAALFALAAQIVVPPSPELEHLARHAGLAQGIVQVLASLPRAAAHRQSFVPLQLLERHGSNIEEVFAGRQTPAIRGALDELAAQARQHLETALQLLMDAPRTSRPLFLPLALVRRDLARLTHVDHDPFTPQPRSHLATLWTLWRASRSRTFRGG